MATIEEKSIEQLLAKYEIKAAVLQRAAPNLKTLALKFKNCSTWGKRSSAGQHHRGDTGMEN